MSSPEAPKFILVAKVAEVGAARGGCPSKMLSAAADDPAGRAGDVGPK